MPDREKVIKGLECHVNLFKCHDCPYVDAIHPGWGCHLEELIADALALLKEQEPVRPIRLENWWKCPSCSGNIVANMNYCPRCGKAVKWDD